jgi:hypothetical protein
MSVKAIAAVSQLKSAGAVDGVAHTRRRRRQHNVKTGWSEFMKDEYSQLKSVNIYDYKQELSLSVALPH